MDQPSVAELDASYVRIDDVDDWTGIAVPAEPWRRYVERLEQARSTSGPGGPERVLVSLNRAAAFDTGAIEGLYEADRGITISILDHAASWESIVADSRGVEAVDLVRAQIQGYEMALDVATGEQPLSESWLRHLHATICGPQETYDVRTSAGLQRHLLPKGVYKRVPNHVRQPDGSWFPFAPVGEVAEEVRRLVAQLRSPAFETLHPVLQAAYAHYSFVRIHPFADGNGRVSRALASVWLLRAASIPLLVYADEKPQYFGALAAADEGRREVFVRYLFERALTTMALAVSSLAEGEDPWKRLSTELQESRRADATLDAVGARIVDLVGVELQSQLDDVLPEGMNVRIQPIATGPQLPGARVLDGPTTWNVDVRGRGRWSTEQITVYASLDRTSPFTHHVVAWKLMRNDPLDLTLAEVHPEPTSSFRARLRSWTTLLVRRIGNQLLAG